MAITYPRSLPAIPIKMARLGLNINQSIFESSFSRKVTVQSHAGGTTDYWEGLYQTPTLSTQQLRELAAWLISMKGMQKHFYAYDPDRRVPTGVARNANSAPKVNGGGQTGHSLVTSGWLASTAGLLKAGDYVQVGSQYYMVLEDVNSDASGIASLNFEPAIRTSPNDQDAVIIENPQMIARLQESKQTWESDEKGMANYSFAWEEVV